MASSALRLPQLCNPVSVCPPRSLAAFADGSVAFQRVRAEPVLGWQHVASPQQWHPVLVGSPCWFAKKLSQRLGAFGASSSRWLSARLRIKELRLGGGAFDCAQQHYNRASRFSRSLRLHLLSFLCGSLTVRN